MPFGKTFGKSLTMEAMPMDKATDKKKKKVVKKKKKVVAKDNGKMIKLKQFMEGGM